ncbi:hypothetical protein RIF29_24578 [Crotalaria pallida]|uniref:Uncharacterized protein n=1 Tax=Crotalaria pallida TaxID=3830 RepID=A0AAN9HZ17_CROPI
MASKRGAQEGNDHMHRQNPGKRRHGVIEQEETSITLNEKWMNELASLIRRVVREEFQRHLSPSCRLSLNHEGCTSSGGRALELCFMNQLPQTIFTQFKIMAEDGVLLQIELRDATYHHRIVSEEASLMKVKLCVLDGDFGSENWTAEEFKAKTLSPRNGKGPLLIGETVITLKNGVGYITNKIVFSDNSCWTRSGMFRLGVEVLQSTFNGAGIREGRSEPFKVKDNRGEVYKKHDCPSLNDEVWRLKRIAKGGKIHNKLSSNSINTIRDLLQLYITNQASLKEIMGNIPGKWWDTIIEHAKTCNIDDDKCYVYLSLAAEQSVSLFFNCIYEVIGVSFNDQSYCLLETLNFDEKRMVERLKQQAYTNVKENLILLETTPHSLVNTLAVVQPVQHGALDQALQQFDFSIAQQGQPETWQNMCGPSTSKSYIDEATLSDQLGSSEQQLESEDMAVNWLGQFTTGGAHNDENQLPISGLHTDQLSPLIPSLWEQVNFSYSPNVDGAESSNHSTFPSTAMYIASKGKRRTVWNKIRTAMKWVILHLSKKRKAKHFHPHGCKCISQHRFFASARQGNTSGQLVLISITMEVGTNNHTCS